jgi:hypothetical protein
VLVLDIQPPQTVSSCMCRFVAGLDRGGSFGEPVNGRLYEIEEVCLNYLVSFVRGSARRYISHGGIGAFTDPTTLRTSVCVGTE